MKNVNKFILRQYSMLIFSFVLENFAKFFRKAVLQNTSVPLPPEAATVRVLYLFWSLCWSTGTFINKGLQHRCFPVNIAKF